MAGCVICGKKVNPKKELLEKYLPLKTELRGLERRLAELEDGVYGLGVGGSSKITEVGKRKGTAGGFSSLLDKKLDEQSGLKKLYEDKQGELIDTLAEIECAVAELEPLERAVIRAKFIDGLTWEEVAPEVGYSVRTVYRMVARIYNKWD